MVAGGAVKLGAPAAPAGAAVEGRRGAVAGCSCAPGSVGVTGTAAPGVCRTAAGWEGGADAGGIAGAAAAGAVEGPPAGIVRTGAGGTTGSCGSVRGVCRAGGGVRGTGPASADAG